MGLSHMGVIHGFSEVMGVPRCPGVAPVKPHLRQARTTHLQGIQLGCILAALEGLS